MIMLVSFIHGVVMQVVQSSLLLGVSIGVAHREIA